MLVEKVIESKQAKIRLSPCHTNRASEAGHPCSRYLVFRRTRWQDQLLHDVRTQCLFDDGNVHEEAVMNDLRKAGFSITEQQRDYSWPALELTAHLDGKVVLSETEAAPIEIKSMHPSIWERIHSLPDLLKAKQPWLQKYPAQITLYLLLGNAPRGFLILKNKATGELKEIEVTLDLDYAESLLKKLERVNAHVKAGTLPERIPYDESTCGRCPFLHLCLPEVKRDALEILTDPALEAKLSKRAELAPLAREYEALDKEVKAVLKEHERLVIGEFLIQGRWVEKTMPPQPEKHSRYWLTKIDSLQPKGNDHA